MNVPITLRTSDLAHAAQISVQQVRNYEASGYIPAAERSPSGYRRYTRRHLDALVVARLLIVGYGGARALEMLRAAHAGRLPQALALIDERHAELAATRRQLEQTLAALGVLAESQPAAHVYPQRLRVGAAAHLVGVRVSAVRFWEQQGLLQPVRDPGSRYRLYDERQLRRLRVVALLRQASHGFATIHATLDEIEAGRPERAIAAVEQRRDELAQMSWRCLEALAALHAYLRAWI